MAPFLLMRGDSRVLAGSAGQNASRSMRDLLIALLLCGDSRVLAGSAGQNASRSSCAGTGK